MVPALSKTETTLRISHTFRAPRERVFRAFTDPEELKRWSGPVGYETRTASLESLVSTGRA